MNEIRSLYVLNGLVVLFIGLLLGFPFAKAIKRGSNREASWRLAHSASCTGGIMLLSIGSNIDLINIPRISHLIVLWAIFISTYSFVAGMTLAALSGQRGIGTFGASQNIAWKSVYFFYFIGSSFSLFSIGYLLIAYLYVM